jgi:uncharacterized protein YbjQ (UPF0145 family)
MAHNNRLGSVKMAECRTCKVKIAFWSEETRCKDCRQKHAKELTEKSNLSAEAKERQEASMIEEAAQVDAIMLTTETAPNLNITKRIEIVTAECAFGMNLFKDLFAGVRNVVGGRSEAVQQTMRDSRRTALYELKREAYEVGANAVVGVDLDYVELSGAGSMVMLVASGTAVIIED